MTGRLVYTRAVLSFGWRVFIECFYGPHGSAVCCFRLFRICLVVVLSFFVFEESLFFVSLFLLLGFVVVFLVWFTLLFLC